MGRITLPGLCREILLQSCRMLRHLLYLVPITVVITSTYSPQVCKTFFPRDLPVPLLFSAVSVVSPWPQLPIPHPPAGILPFLDVSSIRDTGYRLARIAREDCAFMGPEGVLAKVMIVCLCRRGFPPSMPDWLRYQPGNCFLAMDKMGYTRVFLGQNRA